MIDYHGGDEMVNQGVYYPARQHMKKLSGAPPHPG